MSDDSMKVEYFKGTVLCTRCGRDCNDEGYKDKILAFKSSDDIYHAWCKACDFSVNGSSFEDIDNIGLFRLY